MITNKLYAILAKKTGYRQNEVHIIFSSIIETRKEQLLAGETIKIKCLGDFELQPQKVTRRRDVNTGNIIDIPEKNKVVYTKARRLNMNEPKMED